MISRDLYVGSRVGGWLSVFKLLVRFEATLVQDFAFSNNTKIFQHIKSITKPSFIPSRVFYKHHSASFDTDKAILFNKYFYSVFVQSTYSLPPLSHNPSISSSLSSINISEEEVYY